MSIHLFYYSQLLPFIHHDPLSPHLDENILIDPKTLEIKILDLGASTALNTPQVTLFYGTTKFAAPECVKGIPYHVSTQEIWALGTLLFVLLYKSDPFRDERESLTLEIESRIKQFKEKGRVISKDAENAIKAMMEPNAVKRIRLQDVKQLAFLTRK